MSSEAEACPSALTRSIQQFVKDNCFLKGLAKAGSMLAVLQILVVALTFLKEVALTTFFGLTQFMDAYTLVNNVLIFTRSYFEQLGYGALIPAYGHFGLKTSEAVPESVLVGNIDVPEYDQHLQCQLLNTIFNYTCVFILVIGLILAWEHQSIAWMMAPNWSGKKLADLQLLAWAVLPSRLLFQIAEIQRILSIQEKRFVLYQLPRVVSLCLFILCFAMLYPRFHMLALVIALPLSQFAELFIYCYFLGIRWQWIWKTPGLDQFLKMLGPVSVSWVIFSLSLLVDNFFLSFLPTGQPSAFRYGYVSVLIAGSLTVTNLQLASLPAINQASLARDMSVLKKLLQQSLQTLMVFSVPMIAGSVVLAPWLIKLVFERGAFTAHNTVMVAQCFQILMGLLPYTALWRMLSSCYYNLNLIQPLLAVGLILLVLRFGMEWVGLHLWGMSGIAWMVLGNSYLLLAALWLVVMQQKSDVPEADSVSLRS